MASPHRYDICHIWQLVSPLVGGCFFDNKNKTDGLIEMGGKRKSHPHHREVVQNTNGKNIQQAIKQWQNKSQHDQVKLKAEQERQRCVLNERGNKTNRK